jgi:predicted nucleotidyltransferase
MITDILAQKEYKHRETRSLEFEEDLSNTFKELIDLIFRQSVKKYKYIQIPLTNTNLFIQHI